MSTLLSDLFYDDDLAPSRGTILHKLYLKRTYSTHFWVIDFGLLESSYIQLTEQ